MKLIRQLLISSLTLLIAMPASADLVKIYGKANLSLQSSDDGEGRYTEVKSNASRIGFTGKQALNDDLTLLYKAEFGVDLDGDSNKGDSITDRTQYIGLSGSFGEVLVGNNNTMIKQAQGKIDLFNAYNADIKSLFKGENRMSDTVTYKTPSYNGFKLGVQYLAADSTEGDDAVSIGVFYGDKYLKKSQLYAAVAVDSDVKGYDITRFVIQGKLAGFVLAGMAQTQESASGAEMDGILLSAKYGIDKWTLKSQFQMAEHDSGEDKSAFSLGADYKFTKNTKLYSFYSTFDMDSDADQDYLALGLEFSF